MNEVNKSNFTKGIIYGGIAGVLWGTLGVFIALLPVSYTHLDVYKRQAFLSLTQSTTAFTIRL